MVSKDIITQVQRQLSSRLKTDIAVKTVEQVYGGDINRTWKLTTNISVYFLKTNEHAFADMFEKEFHGLNLLKNAAALRVPEPFCYGSSNESIFLAMEFVRKGRPGTGFWKKFAEDLANLHRQTQAGFGLDRHNYIGSLPQQNTSMQTWDAFYTTQRIMPLIGLAHDQKKCTVADVAAAEKLCAKLCRLLPEERPSLLHGDLWSGNFMINENGEAVIYDPATYYGHREMDIAMTLLFGGFDGQFYHHYNEVFPLQPGWRQRVDICQLYPLLVHLVLFGGHYYYSVMEIVRKYV